MDAQYILADLQTALESQSSQSSIHFRDMAPFYVVSVERHHGLPGLVSILPCSTTPTIPYNEEDNKAYQKAWSRGRKFAALFENLLNGGGMAMKTSCSLQRTPYLQLRDEALIVGSPLGTPTRTREGISSFHNMEFNFPGAKPVVSSQMLHITCPGLRSEESLFDKDGGPLYDSVTVLTGMCLFTRKILDESVSDGFLDIQKLLDVQLTLYEVERIAGLSSAIADIAALIFSKYDGKCHGPLNIILDLPTWHYYQSIEDRLQHRGYKPCEVMDWIEAIILRSQQLAGVLKSAVLHELDRRGVPSSRRLYDIQISPGSALVNDAFREALKYENLPCLNNILETLSSSQDGSWRQFYSLLSDRDKPQTIKDLGYLFYIFEVVRPVVLAGMQSRKQSTPTQSADMDSAASCRQQQPASTLRYGSKQNHMPRPLVISVDDPSERKLYSKAHSIFLKLPKSPTYPADPTLVQVYTTRRVFVDGNKKGGRLYRNDPSPVMPVLGNGKVYGDRGDAGYSKHARELQQMDFIAKLYGAECAANIQRWSKEVGLCGGHSA
ncbi:hypothetical protein BBP40_009063 [Aspergillus hancockii]|nr:hypothetical protein BBP40_009063 [Aspergillus hancockii]